MINAIYPKCCALRNWISSTYSQHEERINCVISTIAFLAFSAFAWRFSTVMWGLGLGVGICFRKEVKSRITDLFENIMNSHFSWKLATFAAGGLMYWFCLPGMLVIQGAMAGAATGSMATLAIERHLPTNRSILLLLRC